MPDSLESQPPQMLLLLGRMDGKLDGILTSISSLTSRTDAHEERIGALEQMSAQRDLEVPRFHSALTDIGELKAWKANAETVSKAALALSGVLRWAFGGACAVAIWLATQWSDGKIVWIDKRQDAVRTSQYPNHVGP